MSLDPTSSVPSDPILISGLNHRDEIDILLTEYKFLTDHSRMYVEQFSPKFSVFAIFVLSGSAFAFQNPQYAIIFAMIPVFIFLIGFVTISQVYILTVWSRRLAAIENRIKELNGGISILQAASEISPRYIYTPLVWFRFRFAKKPIRIANPILIAVVFMVLTSLPLIAYSTWKTYLILPPPGGMIYSLLSIMASIVMVALSFISFFGGEIDIKKRAR